MEWHVIDESLRRKSTLHFRLSAGPGDSLALSAFRNRSNLVLLFLDDVNCVGCLEALRAIAANQQAYQELEAEIVAIFRSSPEDSARLKSEQHYPFPVLADPEGAVRREYAGMLPSGDEPGIGVFVLDRFGGPYAGIVTGEDGLADLQEGILGWLGFIEIQCPECGIPEWPSGPY